jgi:hypothetical protein
LLVNLRSDPRYEKFIAPARERMAAQIAAAQAAGCCDAPAALLRPDLLRPPASSS